MLANNLKMHCIRRLYACINDIENNDTVENILQDDDHGRARERKEGNLRAS